MLKEHSEWKPGTRIFSDAEELEIYEKRKPGPNRVRPEVLAVEHGVTVQTIHNVVARVRKRVEGAA